ncbi:MAG: M48 family peptidase [Chloroflexota bacterium]|nr:MAG: M48 family peptidase [Chloroflexota bacterium]
MTLSVKQDYTIRESPRAKYARLKLSLRDGLVVIVPKGFDHDRIPGLLKEKKRWLEQAHERIETQRKFFEPEPPGALPERLSLRGIGEEWAVDYRSTDGQHVVAVERRENRLLIYGDTDNIKACKEALLRWLNRKTHEHLEPWLIRLASERGFALNRVLIKSQRTRWGSCSKRKTISLNLKLLFIPEDLIRYVLIHELCHTVQLNHSRAFWELIKHFDPAFLEKDERLRKAWRYVPAWLEAKRMLGRGQ